MKTATTPLRTLIESGQFFKADLYTITLIDGTILRTTNADVDLVWGANTFYSDRPAIKRDKLSVKLGLEVDELSLVLYPKAADPDNGNPADSIGGLSFPQAILRGALDGATILFQKAYISTWPTIVGVLYGFQGQVSQINGGRGEYTVDVKSPMELLNVQMPRNVYQSTCLHTLYDAGCTLVRASFTVTGAVAGSSSTQLAVQTNRTEADNYFDKGVIVFTSGANNGLRRTVKSFHHASGQFDLILPLFAAPAAGDTFSAYPGCDRLQATCSGKFNNLTHFKGYPYIPTPETVY